MWGRSELNTTTSGCFTNRRSTDELLPPRLSDEGKTRCQPPHRRAVSRRLNADGHGFANLLPIDWFFDEHMRNGSFFQRASNPAEVSFVLGS